MQAVEPFTPAMMVMKAGDVLYHAILTIVSAHRVGNQPGRVELRFKKSHPAWEQYMTKPRSQSLRRLNSGARALGSCHSRLAPSRSVGRETGINILSQFPMVD